MSEPRTAPTDDPLAARRVALSVLDRVLRARQPLDDTLTAHGDFLRLAPRDRAFVRLLVATTLRRLGEIDAALGRLMEKPLAPRAHLVRGVLRLAVAQLAFLGTPAHAAVDTAVSLAATLESGAYKGLVNAVLRRVAQEGDGLWAGTDRPRLNCPAWLWDSWIATYGESATRAIAAAHLLEAPLDITPKAEPALWAERLQAELLPTGTLRRAAGGRIEELPGYAEGAWWVQDAAAALPARLLGDVAGRQVVDLCAAPGGKTLQLAAAGARVIAVDLSAKRLKRVAENLGRVGLTATLVAADGATWRPDSPPDAVLLDAPCSATGTMRRHPDIAWLKSDADVARLVAVQAKLLDQAIAMVRPGGLVVYAVCSLQPQEGPARVTEHVNAGIVERVPLTPAEVGGLAEAITPEGDLRTLPSMWSDRSGMDGFFAARLRRLA
ncbi:MAG: MFS transporter [Alphaproteobacteria bacterium]|nr:MFS transporter [Alphaproteobacteria bacterium]